MVATTAMQDNIYVEDYTKHIRFAKVTKVYDSETLADSSNYGTVDLVWLDTKDAVNGHVSFLKTGYSSVYGYGIIVMPSIGDIAACYTLPMAQPIIIGFMSKDQYEASKADRRNTDVIGYIPSLKSGEILIKSKSQSSILLRSDGTVDITIQDGNKKNSVPVPKTDSYLTELISNKSNGDHSNTVLSMSLGIKEDQVGPSSQIFSLNSGNTFNQLYTLDGIKNQLTYSLKPLTGHDVIGFEYVKIYTESEEGRKVLTKVLDRNSKVNILKSYYYTQGLSNASSSEPTCNLDNNGIVVTLTLPANVAGLLKKNTTIEVMLVLRKNNFSFRVNDLGDLFIDCRNMVVKSREGKSCFGLFDDSRITCKATEVNIGDKLGGFVKTNRDGVAVSSGIYEDSAIENIKHDHINSVVGETYYFYIIDQFPLFSYKPNNESNKFAIVPLSEYRALHPYDIDRITCRPFDPDNKEGGFTRKVMEDLLEEAAKTNTSWIPYGEMRAL